MKRIFIFVGMKVVEIGALLLVLWPLSVLGNLIQPEYVWWMKWLPGLCVFVILPLVCLVLLGAICGGIWEIIKKNWEWAGKIRDKSKTKRKQYVGI